ncbi:MAG: hypothetical protein ChlgKO_11780 [Chlamydiales bacterium]
MSITFTCKFAESTIEMTSEPETQQVVGKINDYLKPHDKFISRLYVNGKPIYSFPNQYSVVELNTSSTINVLTYRVVEPSEFKSFVSFNAGYFKKISPEKPVATPDSGERSMRTLCANWNHRYTEADKERARETTRKQGIGIYARKPNTDIIGNGMIFYSEEWLGIFCEIIGEKPEEFLNKLSFKIDKTKDPDLYSLMNIAFNDIKFGLDIPLTPYTTRVKAEYQKAIEGKPYQKGLKPTLSLWQKVLTFWQKLVQMFKFW